MGDTEQDAINALRAAGLESEARAVEALRERHRQTIDAYHAGQRSAYQSGLAEGLAARGIEVRSTETEGLGPEGAEPGPAGTRPEQGSAPEVPAPRGEAC